MTTPLPDYDPDYADQLKTAARGYLPRSVDGLTHALDHDGDGPLCGAVDGTRLAANWQAINCGDCRIEAVDEQEYQRARDATRGDRDEDERRDRFDERGRVESLSWRFNDSGIPEQVHSPESETGDD